MCGIAGVFHFKGAYKDTGLIESMTEILTHRGPDDTGVYRDGPVALGHRRLAIIDLETGHQPMTSADGAHTIVFNGEVYNFPDLRRELEAEGCTFATKSDTEVVLHAYRQWKERCLDRLDGIFAFAVYSKKDEALFLARDHLGVKPLYYHASGGRLVFASEIKAIFEDKAVPREIDLHALDATLTYRFAPSPETIFKGIRKLPPACFMTSSRRETAAVTNYWTTTPATNLILSEKDFVAEYRERLEATIRRQMIADVPVGLLLSSGADSSAVLHWMNRASGGPVRTFTVGFEGGEATNETAAARRFSAKFDTVHKDTTVSADDYENAFRTYMWHLEEPIGNESALAYYFISKLAAGDVKVVLTGQGADEPWAGYERYKGLALSKYYAALPKFLTDGLIKPAIKALPRNERLKRGVESLSERDFAWKLFKMYSIFTPEMKARLYKDEIKAELRDADPINHIRGRIGGVGHLDELSRMLYLDTRMWLPDDLLTVGDKLSMAHSLEARVPYLDRTLIEFVETIPPNLKLADGAGKYLHKKALSAWIDRDIVYMKKKGFANPVGAWLRSATDDFASRVLLAPGSACAKYFNLDFLKKLVTLHRSGRENYMRQIFLLVSFEMCHRTFLEGER